MNNSLRLRTVVLALCLVAVIIFAISGFGLVEKFIDKTEAGGVSAPSAETVGKTYYQGSWYVLNENIETVLIIGVDRYSDAAQGDTESYQADFLALVIMDEAKKQFEILHLNRDTMADIPLRDIAGIEYGSRFAQITLAHTYGATEQSRSHNTANAVSRLLYSAPVDYFISLTMDSLAVLNDTLGGVTLRIEEDMTAIDPAFREGAVVTLHGEQALAFVRARGGLGDSTNVRRMERQRQYIGALFERFSTVSLSDNESADALLSLNETMVSDLTMDQLSSLEARLKDYSYAGIRTLAGESVKGKEYMEFYVDEAAVQKAVIDLFYLPVADGE